MKTITIIYAGDDWDKTIPFTKQTLNHSYSTWGEICQNSKITLTRSSVNWFQSGKFTKYWQYVNGKWKKKDQPLTPHSIYDKCQIYHPENGTIFFAGIEAKYKLSRIAKMVNYPQFNDLFNSKLNQYLAFSHFMPKTYFRKHGELWENPNKAKWVVKHLYGSGGKFVKFTESEQLSFEHDSIVQEFINAHDHESLRDYRIHFINDEPIFAYSRIAVSGSLYTNVSQGGTMHFIPLSELTRLLEFAKPIVEQLDVFKQKVFALDFFHSTSEDKYYLIELTTMPGFNGFDNPEGEKILANYLHRLNLTLVS